MLAICDVHVSFAARQILSGVSCTFERGKITGLIGDNGAGKTTLLRTATTMLAPTAGEVRFDSKTLLHRDVSSRAHIGALIETPGHYDELTVKENIRFFYSFHCHTGKTLTAKTTNAVQRFQLERVCHEKVGKLSTGFRQRVAIARAFHPGATVVLLDEPLAGLDPTTRTQVKQTMRILAAEGVAVCLSSHGLGDLDALCDRLYVLAAGRLHSFRNFAQIRECAGLPAEEDLDVVYTRLVGMLSGTAQ